MAKSSIAILFLAGIGFAGSGFGMWRGRDAINGFVNNAMKIANPNVQPYDIMRDMNLIYGLIAFGVFLIVCGVLVSIFGRRQ